MITDRMRFTVLQANTDAILTRDLVVKEPQVVKNLSGPSAMEFKIAQGESVASSAGISWKNWGQWVLVEIEIDGTRVPYAYGIVTDNKVDPASGDMHIQCTGPLGYLKGIPFLVNFNPIAVDPFEIAQRIWAHVQSFSNAALGIVVEPSSSGTQLLPGYSFDGGTLSFDFFAVFYRAVDFDDCSDILNGLARDIPFDMIETFEWNTDRSEVTKKIVLGYPQGGVQQDFMTFRLGENVIQAEKAEELDIEPVSDVIIRSWLPGKVISSELSNEDPTRLRRTIMEENVNIETDERAAAWAKRKLQRRNIPTSFKSILIDPNHPHGPFGHFDVGDSIWVSAKNYPWYGTIEGWHRITAITYSETAGQQGGGQPSSGAPPGMMKLDLKVEGAFNYDPIQYNPDYAAQPVFDPNRVYNGYFVKSLVSWKMVRGQWIRTAGITYDTKFAPNSGAVRIDCDDVGEQFLSSRFSVTPGEHLTVQAAVQYENVVSTAGVPGFALHGFTSLNGAPVGSEIVFDSIIHPSGASGWNLLQMLDWTVPDGVNELALQLTVLPAVTAGTAFWTYVRCFPTGFVVTPV